MIDKDIRKILSVACKSPSSHNTQPWVVSIKKNKIHVGYNQERWLRIADPNKRELFVSLGCFIQSVIISSESLGYKTKLSNPSDNPKSVVYIELTKYREDSSDSNMKLLINRASSRENFDMSKNIPNFVLKKFSELKIENAKIKITYKRKNIENISELTYRSTFLLMSDKKFRTELSTWIRNNWTKKHDGMPGYTQGIPGIISLFAKIVVSKIPNTAKDQAKKDSNRIRNSSCIGLIYIPEDNINNWISSGRLYLKATIFANKYDLKNSALSSPAICSETKLNLLEEFELNKYFVPITVLRFGYSDHKTKSAPKMNLEEIII